MTVVYEWDVEEVAAAATEYLEEGEVVDHFHQTSFADARALAATQAPAGSKFLVVLVRDDDEGRSWAYLEDDGTLPSHFHDANGEDTAKVPKRFHQEVAR